MSVFTDGSLQKAAQGTLDELIANATNMRGKLADILDAKQGELLKALHECCSSLPMDAMIHARAASSGDHMLIMDSETDKEAAANFMKQNLADLNLIKVYLEKNQPRIARILYSHTSYKMCQKDIDILDAKWEELLENLNSSSLLLDILVSVSAAGVHDYNVVEQCNTSKDAGAFVLESMKKNLPALKIIQNQVKAYLPQIAGILYPESSSTTARLQPQPTKRKWSPTSSLENHDWKKPCFGSHFEKEIFVKTFNKRRMKFLYALSSLLDTNPIEFSEMLKVAEIPPNSMKEVHVNITSMTDDSMRKASNCLEFMDKRSVRDWVNLYHITLELSPEVAAVIHENVVECKVDI